MNLSRRFSERETALAILRRHGWNATSFQALEQGFSYWLEAEDALVAYVDTGSAWVAAGAPVAAPERLPEVTARFIASARKQGRRVCFFAAEARLAALGNLEMVCVGEQPIWNPQEWPTVLRKKRSLREQLRRARAKGVTVRALTSAEVAQHDGATRRALEVLAMRWLGSRPMAPMGFLVALEPFELPEERRYFLAERNGNAVAFLAAVPIYGRCGWLIEDLIRDPAAPNGTAEVLIDAAFSSARDEGSRYVTLGLAPLSGAVPSWLRVIRALGAALYDFQGLRAFKARLSPDDWIPIYLAFPKGGSSTLALFDTLTAFARGSFIKFGFETVLRGPAVVVRVLAAMLVPWTAMLALADTHRWFPSAMIQHAWVAFDVGLFLLLFTLAGRWHAALGKLLAICVTIDAFLTLTEAFAYNAPRAHGVVEISIISLACFAPILAATVLWGAVHNRRHAQRRFLRTT